MTKATFGNVFYGNRKRSKFLSGVERAIKEIFTLITTIIFFNFFTNDLINVFKIGEIVFDRKSVFLDWR
jgi:hypothetical protein